MNQFTPPGKDPVLWDLAKRRASFKSHFTTYILVNLGLWGLWFFSGRYDGGIPWPVWPTFGWGIGIAFHYAEAYVTTKSNAVEKEYDKLIQHKNQ